MMVCITERIIGLSKMNTYICEYDDGSRNETWAYSKLEARLKMEQPQHKIIWIREEAK